MCDDLTPVLVVLCACVAAAISLPDRTQRRVAESKDRQSTQVLMVEEGNANADALSQWYCRDFHRLKTTPIPPFTRSRRSGRLKAEKTS